MASAALSKEHLISIANRSHARDLRYRHMKAAMESALVRKASVAIFSATMGAMARHGVPNDIKGFPWKVIGWTVLTAGEALSKGMVQSICAGGSDALMAIYTHNAVQHGTLVAGDVGAHGGELAA